MQNIVTLTVGYCNQELFHVVSCVAVFYSKTTFLVVGRHIVSSIHMKAIAWRKCFGRTTGHPISKYEHRHCCVTLET